MPRNPGLEHLQTALSLVFLFLLTAYQGGIGTAACFVTSLIAGWMNVFAVLHGLLALAKGNRVSGWTWLISTVTIIVDCLLIYLGQVVIVALATSCCLVIDAVVLGFSGQPTGTSDVEN